MQPPTSEIAAIAINNCLINSGSDAIEMILKMVPLLCLWLGVMKIAEKSGMMDALANRLTPLMDILFPSIPRTHRARKYIAANFAANFLGLGWAATPAGLKAMEELQKLNREEKGTASSAMCMFLTVNMTSLQLVTVNVLAFRAEYGSQNPAEIVGVGIVATLITTFVGVFAAKIAEGRIGA
jgi:spore maturation protein A